MTDGAPCPLLRIPAGVNTLIVACDTALSPSEVVRELVARSLAASAADVGVEVDFQAWAVRVQDNGSGLSLSIIDALGSQAAGATTGSKRLGGLIAIFAQAERAEVVNHPAGSFETRRLVLCRGQVTYQGVSMEQQDQPGTSISLHGLFYQQPVRRNLFASGWASSRVVCKSLSSCNSGHRLSSLCCRLEMGRCMQVRLEW